MGSCAAAEYVSSTHPLNLKPPGAHPSLLSPSDGVPGLLHGSDASRDPQSDASPSGPYKSIGGGPVSFLRLYRVPVDVLERSRACDVLYLIVATNADFMGAW